MVKVFVADIEIIEGGGILAAGKGHANEGGLSARGGGAVPWGHIEAIRKVESRAGSASAGALVAGGIGLLGGPAVAAAAAVGGAVVATISGAQEMWVMRHATGRDLLVTVSAWQTRAMVQCHARISKAAEKNADPPKLQRFRRLLPGRTKGDA